MWEAIGTVGATTLALIAIFGKWIKDWLQRPRFDFHIYTQSYPNPLFKGFYFDIHNKGRTTALNVKINLYRIQFKDASTEMNADLKEMRSLRWRDVERYEIFRTHYSDPSKIAYDAGGFGFFDRQDCEIELIITGDNFKGFSKKLKFTNANKIEDTNMIIIQ
jgi:hypothetical protein